MEGNLEFSKELTILNSQGVHARPAASFVKLANQFSSEITVEKDSEVVNGKSIMGLMMLAIACGTAIKVRAVGSDSEKAVLAIEELINSKFDNLD